jgi:hypothetical protein
VFVIRRRASSLPLMRLDLARAAVIFRGSQLLTTSQKAIETDWPPGRSLVHLEIALPRQVSLELGGLKFLLPRLLIAVNDVTR